jgi:uncharacterized protein (TIGR02453 family)
MTSSTRFSQASIDFIVKASRQKKKDWLEKNRDEYEAVLVEPMRELMQKAERALLGEAAGYRFPKRNFARILRGAEGAKVHGPFRDWVGVSVSRDSESRYESLPNLYFHISEGEGLFTAGGLYLASADQTKHIRRWIDQDPSLLEELLHDREFKKHFKELGQERVLKTKPRDYSADHPKIEWLRLSGWYVWRELKKKELFSKNFAEILIEDWRQVLRLNQILDRYTRSWPGTHAEPALPQARTYLDDWED